MFAVRRRDHVEMVPVKVPFSGAIPARIAIGLGVNTRMVAFSYTAGATITSGFAPGIGCGDDRCSIAGGAKAGHIPEQAQLCRYGEDLRLKEVEEPVGRQECFLVGMTHELGLV